MMEKLKGILEELTRIVGCLYISDLHDSVRYADIKKALTSIETGCYSDREWREAYEYITGKRLGGETEDQVRALFHLI